MEHAVIMGERQKGVTIACLNAVGKRPSVNERFASVEIISEKKFEQDLMSGVGVGIKSSRHELPGILDNSFSTSSGVTGGRLSRFEPERSCS